MHQRIRDRGPLSIPSFASERCRSMAEELVITLEGIAPTDDQALEDRALACFVVACGELALMSDSAQCETIVAQLTTVARRLVGSAAKQTEPGSDPEPEVDRIPHVGMTWDQVEAVLKQEQATRRRF
jgi:hypothetical protein